MSASALVIHILPFTFGFRPRARSALCGIKQTRKGCAIFDLLQILANAVERARLLLGQDRCREAQEFLNHLLAGHGLQRVAGRIIAAPLKNPAVTKPQDDPAWAFLQHNRIGARLTLLFSLSFESAIGK